ncbi:unnamed protein product [Prunus brigantina]
MSPFDFDDFAKKLGYQECVGYYYRVPEGVNELESKLVCITNDKVFNNMFDNLLHSRVVVIYFSHGISCGLLESQASINNNYVQQIYIFQTEIGPEEEEFDEYNSEDLKSLDENSSSDEEPNSVNRRRMKKKLPKSKQFRRETDIRTIEFHLGMVFANAKEFKEAVKWHFVNHCRSYKFKINYWYKVKAVCKAEPCLWSVYASSNDCLTDIPLYMLKH